MGCFLSLCWCGFQFSFWNYSKCPAVIALQQVETAGRTQSTEPWSLCCLLFKVQRNLTQDARLWTTAITTFVMKLRVAWQTAVVNMLLLWSTTSLTLMSCHCCRVLVTGLYIRWDKGYQEWLLQCFLIGYMSVGTLMTLWSPTEIQQHLSYSNTHPLSHLFCPVVFTKWKFSLIC